MPEGREAERRIRVNLTELSANNERFEPTYDLDGNQTRIKAATGIWTVHHDANNRPVHFEKTEGETVTVVECGYDSMGRRYMKKVAVNGTVTLQHRYIYRGYLQIACCDLKRSAHPVLWLIMWDPAEPVATRRLAIQKDGTWYSRARRQVVNRVISEIKLVSWIMQLFLLIVVE